MHPLSLPHTNLKKFKKMYLKNCVTTLESKIGRVGEKL